MSSMRKLLATLVLLAVTASVVAAADYESMLSDAQTRSEAKDYAGAITLYKSVINAKPGAQIEPRARLALSKAMLRNKQPVADVIAEYETVVKGFPKSAEVPAALLSIGYLHDWIKQEPTEWHTVIEKYPQSKQAAEALFCLGKLSLRKGDTKGAIDLFRQSFDSPNADPKIAKRSRVEAGFAYISQYWQTADKSYLQNARSALRPSDTNSAASASSVSDEDAEDIREHMGMGEIYLIQGFGKEAAQEYQAVLDQSSCDAYTHSVAQYELGCALYAKRDWIAAESAFDKFLNERNGQTLSEKQTLWKEARPGYMQYLTSDPERAAGLSGLELVLESAYWKSSCLVQLRRYDEAKQILNELAAFPNARVALQVTKLSKMCTHMLGQDQPVPEEAN